MKRREFLGAAFGVSLFGLALAGCGGGGHSDNSTGGSVSTNTVSGRVQLPTGTSAPMNELTIVSGIGTSPLSASGEFQVATVADTPTLAMLYWNDSPLLLGMLDGQGSATIDSTSTATALLFVALGAWQFAVDQRAPFHVLLAADPATVALGQTIADRVAANPHALEEQDATIVTALQNALATLAPTLVNRSVHSTLQKRGRQTPDVTPLLLVNPTGAANGIEVVQDGDKEPGFSIINSQRRSRRVYLYRVGIVDGNNVETRYPAAVPIGDVFNMPATQRLGLIEAIGGIFSATSPWSPIQSSRFELPQAENAKKTFYQIVAISPDFGEDRNSEPGFFSESQFATEVTKWREDAASLNESAYFELVFALILEILGAGGLKFNESQFAQAVTRLKNGDAGVVALATKARGGAPLGANILEALNLAANSDIVSQAHLDALQAVYKDVQNYTANRAQILSRMRSGLRALLLIGLTASALDIGAQMRDLADNGKGLRFTADVYIPSVTLNPQSSTIAPGEKATLSANVPGAVGADIIYKWHITGDTLSTLSENGAVNVGTQIETRGKVVTLATTPSTLGPITVSVSAFAVQPDGSRSSLGDASAMVTISDKNELPRYGTSEIKITGLNAGANAISSEPRVFVQPRNAPAVLRSSTIDVLNFAHTQQEIASQTENMSAEIWFEPHVETGAIVSIGEGKDSQFTLILLNDKKEQVYFRVRTGTFKVLNYTISSTIFQIDADLVGRHDPDLSAHVTIRGWAIF